MSESTRAAAAEFTRLVEIMATLRAPDGCPWDREQTIDTLKPFVLEETYEVLEAIDRHDHAALCEELGDFVFEAVFLAQLEAEAGHFTIADSVKSVADKLVRRHPHVFARGTEGEAALDTAGQVRTRWEEIKAQERGQRRPRSRRRCSAASRRRCRRCCARITSARAPRRSASTGRGAGDVVDKIQEEVDELREVVDAAEPPDRSRARRGGDGRPAVRDRQPVAQARASSRRRRCERRTTSSRRGSRR